MDDDKLLHLYLSRDESAVDESIEKYGALCSSIAYSILKDKQNAEECVNDVFFNAWNSIPPQKPKKFSSYLAKITRNLAIDSLRKSNAKKRGASEYEIALEELGECVGTDEVEQKFDESTALCAINSFLETLSAKKRNVFLRRYFYFDSIKEISNRYGLKDSSVKMILKRTRESLKEFLEKEGIEI